MITKDKLLNLYNKDTQKLTKLSDEEYEKIVKIAIEKNLHKKRYKIYKKIKFI